MQRGRTSVVDTPLFIFIYGVELEDSRVHIHSRNEGKHGNLNNIGRDLDTLINIYEIT